MENKTIEQTKKCPKCGEEIQTSAKKCKHCQADLRNWFVKHKVLTVILVLIIIGIIGSVSGGNKSSNSTSPVKDNTTNNSGSTASSPDTSGNTKTGKIGDTVSGNDFAFTVQSIKTASTLGNSYTQKTAQGIYYILSVKIQNNGKETKTINASDFNITDSQNRKFDYSQDGQTAMEMSQGSTDLFLQQVQPSLSVNGNIVFDLPKDATGLKLIAQGDLFSDGVTIDLGK